MATETLAQTSVNGAAVQRRFADIPSCIHDFAAGNFLIVLDDYNRENEGDLIISAKDLTPARAAFMIRYTSGYLCAPVSPARAAYLKLPPMVPPSQNYDPNRTAYTITVDGLAQGVTTGISAHDRSVTGRLLASPNATSDDFRRPGHVLPLIAKAGGVRERRGHTEAAWEFARLAGIHPEAAVIGEMIIDGEIAIDQDKAELPEFNGAGMMRMDDCLAFGERFGIKCCTIEDLVRYVEEREGRLEAPRTRSNLA